MTGRSEAFLEVTCRWLLAWGKLGKWWWLFRPWRFLDATILHCLAEVRGHRHQLFSDAPWRLRNLAVWRRISAVLARDGLSHGPYSAIEHEPAVFLCVVRWHQRHRASIACSSPRHTPRGPRPRPSKATRKVSTSASPS